MLYIVRAYEDGKRYDYEYGNSKHAIEHYEYERNAKIIMYENGVEKIVAEKFNNLKVNV
jgi:hypothetical protein